MALNSIVNSITGLTLRHIFYIIHICAFIIDIYYEIYKFCPIRGFDMCIKFKKIYLKHKALVLTVTPIVLIIALIVILCLSTYIPKTSDTDYDSEVALSNKYITSNTLISAHRAGRTLAPENTISAFKKCFENNNSYKVDILEFDLHITADEKLILLHDDTIDRTSDCEDVYNENNVRAEEKTYSQLLRYNMGYNFKVDGAYPYRESGVDLSDCRIVTLDEVLAYLETQVKDTWKTDLIYVIEIKNDGDLGRKATDILYTTLCNYGILNRTIIGTFNGEISEYMDETYPLITRSAGISEVFQFYFDCMFGIDLSTKILNYTVLQLPYNDYGFNLGKKSIIDYAHKYGIAVQYWTINDEDDIAYLNKIGADAIITDNPQLAYTVINGV